MQRSTVKIGEIRTDMRKTVTQCLGNSIKHKDIPPDMGITLNAFLAQYTTDILHNTETITVFVKLTQ